MAEIRISEFRQRIERYLARKHVEVVCRKRNDAYNLVRADDQSLMAKCSLDKNTTPGMSGQETRRLLRAPDASTVLGLRDHAFVGVCFKTVCRSRAIA